MNRKILFFLLCIIIFTISFACYNAQANEKNEALINSLAFFSKDREQSNFENEKGTVSLPRSIRTIEDSAFDGTNIVSVKLPEGVETVGDKAFANIPTLKNITIPNTTTYIGKNAFKGSTQVTITTAPKSYARTWAKENGIPFIPITSFYAFNTPIQITGLSQTSAEQQKLLLDEETTENKTPNFTGRMSGVIKADKYEKITAFHIQGRAPPMC